MVLGAQGLALRLSFLRPEWGIVNGTLKAVGELPVTIWGIIRNKIYQ